MNPKTTTSVRNKILGVLLLFTVVTTNAQLSGLTITGIPENTTTGASWTYQGTVDNVFYSLQGILMKPQGNGPFPAVIINHGTGGNVNGYSKKIAQEMVKWGYVCIATNYTHAGNAPCGFPGQCVTAEFGGSPNNILRGMKCWDILASFSYVNEGCIYTFGHSRGAYLTTAMVAAHPTKFKAAGHTAGGILPEKINDVVPDVHAAAKITCPYIMHHGDVDLTVPFAYDVRLDSLFNKTGIIHFLHRYPGFGHADVSFDPTMFQRTRDFFGTFGCQQYRTSANDPEVSTMFSIHPNPASSVLNVHYEGNAQLTIFNPFGNEILTTNIDQVKTISLETIPDGMYWCVIKSEEGESIRKLIIKR